MPIVVIYEKIECSVSVSNGKGKICSPYLAGYIIFYNIEVDKTEFYLKSYTIINTNPDL